MPGENKTTAANPPVSSTDDESVDGLQNKIARVGDEIQFVHRAERAMYEVAEDDERSTENNKLADLEKKIDAAEDEGESK